MNDYDYYFEKSMRSLRKDFQMNVLPAVRRHNFAMSKSERRRAKHSRALKRLKKYERLSGGNRKLRGRGMQGWYFPK